MGKGRQFPGERQGRKDYYREDRLPEGPESEREALMWDLYCDIIPRVSAGAAGTSEA